ncbi:MAG TPA: O-antigen ligase family protein [Flavisolibacter sp.]|nr:O-antigen ligase family protein [Flavisolibacter sp.]
MGIRTDKPVRNQLIFLTLLLMLTGLFLSRALLSLSMVAFVLLTLVHRRYREQFMHFFSSPVLISMCLLFFIPFITGLWSEDKGEWAHWCRIKLPLLLFPLAFAGPWRLDPKQWRLLAIAFLFFVFAGCCWSLAQYLSNLEAIAEGYLRAKVFPTPLGNDHVRFSLLVCLAFLTTTLLFIKTRVRYLRLACIAAGIFFAVYLHVLSARTGLLSLYFFLVAGALYLLWRVRTKWTVVVCLLLAAMPLAAWTLLPTFRNRIRYIVYDFSYIRKDIYLPGANDGNRMLSLKAGWSVMNEHRLGAGAGDVLAETNAWYSRHIPQMLETDKIYPSSEWLMYGAGAGWPGFLLFTLCMLLPFFEKMRSGWFFWASLNTISALSFLFDIGLETQFGVFVYAFTVLAWKKKYGLRDL